MATIVSSPSTSSMLPMVSSSLSPNSSNTNGSSTQQHCSMKRALLLLICILIVFLINTNVRGLYLEYSSRSGTVNNGGLAITPIVKDLSSFATKTNDVTNQKSEATSGSLNDDLKRQVEELIQEAAYAADDDATVNSLTYEEYIEAYNGEEEEEECFNKTTNNYRPPNITNTKNHTQHLRKRSRKKKKSKNHHPTIPRRLILTYKTNLFDCYFPKHLFENVQNTIQVYGDFWGIPNKTDVDVMFFDDKECAQAIHAAEPKLVPIFLAEQNGAYRGDICRIAALYLYGGYYLDVDIQPIKALDPPSQVDFITAKAGNNLFFQAIMASKPGHPLLKHTLETMLDDWYMIPNIMKQANLTKYDPYSFRSQAYADLRKNHVLQYGFDPNHAIGILMGPATLRIAFDRRRNVTTPWLLEEIENRMTNTYPKLVRETNHWGCNFLVHDVIHQTAYFYSRCVGTPMCPNLNPPMPLEEFIGNDDYDGDESLDEDPDAVEKSVAYQ